MSEVAIEKNKLRIAELRKGSVLFLTTTRGEEYTTNCDVIIIDSKADFYMKNGNVETFPLNNILVNPVDMFGIKYQEVTNDNFGEQQLPSMAFDDPVRIWYGWKIGTIIKITRPNKRIYYRRVSNK